MGRMERHEGPQTPFEVYCYDCRVTFAAGTSRCVHCGGRLGGRAKRGGAEVITELPDGEVGQPRIARRLGGMSLWVLIALAHVRVRLTGAIRGGRSCRGRAS